MDTIERPALVISVAVIVSEGHAQAASAPEPAVLESTGEAPCTKVTAAEVPTTHGAAEVSAAKTSAEMASTHAPAAMAAASACNSVGGDSGTSQCHGNNGDRDSAQHGLPYGSYLLFEMMSTIARVCGPWNRAMPSSATYL